jgi:RNA polymerase sigma-70 factor (ECF subfamily)
MGGLEALLLRCRSGDAEALEELIRRWERKLFYYIRRLVACESDAWDVLQQTWTRVLQGIPPGFVTSSHTIPDRCWKK